MLMQQMTKRFKMNLTPMMILYRTPDSAIYGFKPDLKLTQAINKRDQHLLKTITLFKLIQTTNKAKDKVNMDITGMISKGFQSNRPISVLFN